ncbi:MAG: hypothetical protein IJI66_06610 [Erysipelotrichaceae bacterium]|nr:hypothetical protein [Erysipelotrichaceae bacterium]
MNKEELLEQLLEQGYSEEEALEEIEKEELEQEHPEWFIFQQIINHNHK